MLKSTYLRNICLSFVFLLLSSSPAIFAHEGHNHENDTVITIGKRTYIHFQSVLLGYQYIYSYMVKGGASEVSGLAQNVIDAATQGIQTEQDGSGQHMMQHILEGAESLKKAKNMSERQEAFATISDALFPFFEQWPNQLMRSRLKICRCKSGHQWLQPENCPTACPYTLKKTSNCLVIEETVY